MTNQRAEQKIADERAAYIIKHEALSTALFDDITR